MDQITTNFALMTNHLINEGKYEEAIELCEEGLVKYPNYPTALCLLAKAYYLLDKPAASFDIINQASKFFPYHNAIKRLTNEISNRTFRLDPFFIDIDSLEFSSAQTNTITNSDAPNNESINIHEHLEALDKIADLLSKINEEHNVFAAPEDAPNEEDIPQTEENTSNENLNNINMPDNQFSNFEMHDEEISLLDVESYYPEHIQQESIAEILDPQNDNISFDEIDMSVDPLESITKEDLTDIESLDDEIETETEVDLTKDKEKFDFTDNSVKTEVKLLYASDLDFAHTEKDYNLDFYTPSHIAKKQFVISPHSILSKITKSKDSIVEEVAPTPDLLSIAEGIKNAKITTEPIIQQEEDTEVDATPLIISETMAKLLVKQGKISQAIKVYEALIEEKPEKIDFYIEQINIISTK